MARNINGGTDRIAFDSLTAQGTTSVCALAFRFKTTQVTVNAILAARWNSSSRNGWGMILNNTLNKVLLQTYGGASVVASGTSTATVNDGNWHDLVLNHTNASGGTSKVYIDGVLDITTGANSSAVGPNANFLQFGDSYDTFWPSYVGDIADVGFWHGINLTADEVAAYRRGFSARLIQPSIQELYAPMVNDHQDKMGLPIGSAGFSGTTVSAHPRVIGSMV